MPISWLNHIFRADRYSPRRQRRPNRTSARRRLEVESLELRRLLTVFVPRIDDVANFDPSEPSEAQAVNLEATFRDPDLVDDYTATIDWGDGVVDEAVIDLDPRGTSSLIVTIDYRFDDTNFFDTDLKKELLQLAADSVIGRFGDTLDAISPGGSNTWKATTINPATGDIEILDNLQIARNEILVFAGARDLPGSTLAIGGFGGFESRGTTVFAEGVATRGQAGALDETPTDFGPWGGSISFTTNPDSQWYFSKSTDGLDADESDFLSVVLHEFGHVFGFGTAPSWDAFVDADEGVFLGPASIAASEDGEPVPLDMNDPDEPDDPPVFGHWADDTMDGGVETGMDPSLDVGTRKLFTPLDFAAFDDIGWELLPEAQGTISGSHVYADNGTYTITTSIEEFRVLGSTEQTFEVTVENVVPTLAAVDDQTIHVGDPLLLADLVTITDPGFENLFAFPPTEETFDVSIDWGDGTPDDMEVATIDVVGGVGVLTEASVGSSHTYSAPDEYEVTVTVTDDDGGVAETTFSVNVIPTLDINGDDLVTDEDTELILDAPGLLDNDLGSELTVTDVQVAGSSIPLDTPFTLASGARLTVHADGSLVYDPTRSVELDQLDDGADATDTITYTATDEVGSSETVTVNIRVDGITNSPVIVDVDAVVVRTASSTDSTGQVPTLPSGEVLIHEWNGFWLEIFVQVRDNKLDGVETALADVAYNSDYFTATSVTPGLAFAGAGGLSSSIDDTAGTVHVDGVKTIAGLVGTEQPVLLARIRFAQRAGDPGVPIELDVPTPVSSVDDEWIALTNARATVIAGASISSVDIGPAPATALYPILYDLDDDGIIGFGDLSHFAAFLFADVKAVPEATKADFDASGTVNFSDFSFFAANFNKNPQTGDSILLPDTFPVEIVQQALLVEADGGPPASATQLTDDQTAAIVREAAARLGISAEDVAVEVVDLPGDLLGRASAGKIELDVDAAGYGWYIDTTPSDDREFSIELGPAEFAAAVDGGAAGRVDLLTVVMHELGHTVGYGHGEAGSLMDSSLPLGTRRLADGVDSLDDAMEIALVDDFFATLDG